MGFEVRQDMICGPDGEVSYTVTEDYDPLAAMNNEERNSNAGWTEDRTMRQALRVPGRLYAMWQQRHPGCWQDKNFVKSFAMNHPEYSTCDPRTL